MKNLMKKLENIHLYFKGQRKDAIYDFINCLKKRLLHSELTFATAYEKAADDLGDPTMVPEAYDKPTIGWIKDCLPFFQEKIFGRKGKKVIAV